MKKIYKSLIFVLMIVFFIIQSNKSYASTGKINSETVRVRREASTESDIIDQLDIGDKVEILEEIGDWYKVTYTKQDNKKITGYISAKLLDVEKTESENENKTEEKPNIEQPSTDNIENNNNGDSTTNTPDNTNETTITDNTINKIVEDTEYEINKQISIKILPLINSKEIAIIDNGKIKVIEIINDWCRIENEIETGWIRTNTLIKARTQTDQNVSTNTQEIQSKPEQTNSDIIKIAYVSTESLKVRKEPNTNCEVIDTLVKNTQISIIKELEEWYEIKIGDKIGYVSKKYISNTKVAETTSRGTTSIIQKEETNTTQIKNEEITNKTENTSKVTGEEIVSYAKQYLGYKYVSGGASPSKGFDCSGFTQYIYKNFGISINRNSKEQIKNGKSVEKNDLQLGDLVVFNDNSNKTIGHVGIYIGSGNFIHASNPSDGVKITSLSTSYYLTRYVGARRLI